MLVCLAVFLALVGIWWLQEGPRAVWRPEEKEWYYDGPDGKRHRFGELLMREEADVDLSIVVPAYNEEARIGPMLREVEAVLTARQPPLQWEVIVVDDGSHRPAELAAAVCAALPQARLMHLARNRGKGGAVRCGMMAARGRRLLMADADGATRFADLMRLEAAMDAHGAEVAIGSRAHLQNEAVARRTVLRNFLMWGFHWVVRWVGMDNIKDSQCGFKLFSRKAARLIFPIQHVERWAFDVELLWIARQLKLPVVEVPVDWHEVDGSKLDPLSASIEMMRDMVKIKFAYMLGIWKVK